MILIFNSTIYKQEMRDNKTIILTIKNIYT